MQLGLRTEELTVISKNNSEVNAAFIKMLEQWLAGKNSSLEALAEALQTQSVDEQMLAQDILLKRCELISFPRMVSLVLSLGNLIYRSYSQSYKIMLLL